MSDDGAAKAVGDLDEGREKRIGERRFEVAEGVWRIPIFTGFASGDVNVYWVDGPDPVLVDTGVLGDRSFDTLADALVEGGRRIEDVRTLLLTHHHVDHAANAWRIKEASGCAVGIHRRAVRRLADIAAAAEADVPGFLAFMRRCGFTEDLVAKYAGFAGSITRISHSCPGLEGLDDGDAITGGGGRTIRAFARPGHSSSDMVYAIDGTGVLLTGDHVLPIITPNPTLEAPEPGDAAPYRALPSYRESLRSTATMDCRLACPGHGLPFDDLAGRCRQILALQDRRLRDVVRILREKGPMSPKDLSLALFGRVRMWDVYLTLSEVRGALDVLSDQGLVLVDRDGAIDRIVAV